MAPDRTGAALPPREQLEALPGLRGLLVELKLWADLEAELDGCVAPRFASPLPTQAARMAGAYFDVAEVRRFLVFCRKLRHVKGKWAGLPLIPDMWQVLYVDAPLFGWRRPDGNRLYSTLYEEIPRKNGKSTSSSAKALYLLMADSNLRAGRLAEAGAEVYAAATTTRQALEVFRPAEQMARRSPSLARRLLPQKDSAIVYEANMSRFEVLSGMSDKAEEKMGLNASGIVIDELHVHKSRKLVDTLDSSTASREQPLTVFITTAGLDDPGSIYAEKTDYARKVATGELEDPSWLVVIYCADPDDDPFVEETWRRANPGLDRSVQIDYLLRKAREAAASPAALNTFLRLHLNIRTGQVTRWVPLSVYDTCGARWLEVAEESLAGRKAYGGLDLSSSVDMTAAVLVLPTMERDPLGGDDLVEVLDVVVRAWTPEGTVEERERRDRAPYQRWVNDRLLSTSPGEVIDYDLVEAELLVLAGRFEIGALNFDRWGSKQIVQHLGAGGLEVWEMGQGYADMTAPMKEVERLLRLGRIRHNNHPLLRWALGALAVRQDPAGNLKPDRDRSTGRIDPFVALVMAVGAWMRAGEAKAEKSKAVVSW